MSVPHVLRRWRSLGRTSSGAYFVKALYIVTSALGIYRLNLFIGFLSPQLDPELQELADGGGPSFPLEAPTSSGPSSAASPSSSVVGVDLGGTLALVIPISYRLDLVELICCILEEKDFWVF